MNSQKAVNCMDSLLKKHNYPFLTDVERQIFCDSWNLISYNATAEQLNYSPDYVRRLAGKLWQRLSLVFDQPVSKKTIRSVLRNYYLNSDRPRYADYSQLSLPTNYQSLPQEGELSRDIIHNYFQVIGIFGSLGTGKTTLAKSITQQIDGDFDIIIWQSFKEEIPDFYQWANSCYQLLTKLSPSSLESGVLRASIEELMAIFKKKRCLLVWDQFEELLTPKIRAGKSFNPYPPYRELLRRLAEETHQSYLIFTSRVSAKFLDLDLATFRSFQSVNLQGLSTLKHQNIFTRLGVKLENLKLNQLLKQPPSYYGKMTKTSHPLRPSYYTCLQSWMTQQENLFRQIAQQCYQEFCTLSSIEKKVILALKKSSKCCANIERDFHDSGLSKQEVQAGLKSLEARSLVKIEWGFIIVSPLFQGYISQRLRQQHPLGEARDKETGTIKEPVHCC